MPARSIQISVDEKLLAEVDRQRETRTLGRSAVIRRALRLYLDLKKRREIDEAYAHAYGGKADAVFDELADMIGSQEWPEK